MALAVSGISRRGRGLALALVCLMAAAGCQATAPAAPRGAPGLSLVPAPTGLAVIGSGGREISFGRDRAGAIETASRVTGARPQPVICAELGLDAVDLGGLRMVFAGNTFVGAADAGRAFGRGCPGIG